MTKQKKKKTKHKATNNHGTMFFMSQQVNLPKISSILQEMKIGLKSDTSVCPFCTKAFNYVLKHANDLKTIISN